MKPLAPNTLLQNRYLIVHLIGKGGMGEVYLAVDQRLGSAIALKRTLHGDDAALGDAFEREARTLARLRHPALPKVSDHFVENDNQFLVMEHISGDDLSKRLTATQKPFPLSWVLFWADQLLDALAYLHSHEPPIIHRDIKPQNLKLTDDNNIVLLDFGLSKNSTGQGATGSGGSGSTGSVVGYTPHYAPMEQIRGTGTSPRSDIYSLSATLYQLLTNVVPPDALSRADFLLSGKTDPIVPINEINNEIPKSISDVVLKGMSISQDQRFTEARQMQRVLRETYAQMQSAMADKTVAFAVPEVQSSAPPTQTPSITNDKTEQFSAPVLDDQAVSKEAMGAQTIPYGMTAENAGGESVPTKLAESQSAAPIPNFDATLKIEDAPLSAVAPTALGEKTEVLPVGGDSASKQSDIKTEVFGGDFGAADYLKTNEQNAAQKSETNDYGAKTNETTPPNITGDKTVPFIEIDNKQASPVDSGKTQPVSAFDSTPQTGNFAPVAAPNEDFAPNKPQTFPNTVPDTGSKQSPTVVLPKPPVQEKKKSKGMLFVVLGALFGLFVLAAAGGGIAYYMMYYQGGTTGGVTNTATPTPAPTATATPEETPALANNDTGNSSNSDVVTNPNNDNSVVNTTETPVTKPTVTQQQTPVVTTNTPKPTTSTPKPATPKPATPKPEVKPTIRGTRDLPQ